MPSRCSCRRRAPGAEAQETWSAAERGGSPGQAQRGRQARRPAHHAHTVEGRPPHRHTRVRRRRRVPGPDQQQDDQHDQERASVEQRHRAEPAGRHQDAGERCAQQEDRLGRALPQCQCLGELHVGDQAPRHRPGRRPVERRHHPAQHARREQEPQRRTRVQDGGRQRQRHRDHHGVAGDHHAARAEPVGHGPAEQEQQHRRQASGRQHQARGGTAVLGRYPAHRETEHDVAELGDRGSGEPHEVGRRERSIRLRAVRPTSGHVQ